MSTTKKADHHHQTWISYQMLGLTIEEKLQAQPAIAEIHSNSPTETTQVVPQSVNAETVEIEQETEASFQITTCR